MYSFVLLWWNYGVDTISANKTESPNPGYLRILDGVGMKLYSENAAVVKALTHPFLATLVTVSWVAMIMAGTEIPMTFEGMAVGVAGSWALKRSYKEYKKVQKPEGE